MGDENWELGTGNSRWFAAEQAQVAQFGRIESVLLLKLILDGI
jgi:hypothetical protein